jgi:hypothetical protein
MGSNDLSSVGGFVVAFMPLHLHLEFGRLHRKKQSGSLARSFELQPRSW